MNQSLTLNVGVRWETDTPMVDITRPNEQLRSAADQPRIRYARRCKFLGLNGYRSNPYDGDWNNFGPRFGFAWKVLGSERHGGSRRIWNLLCPSLRCRCPERGSALASACLERLNSPDNGITAPFYLRDGVPATAAAAPKLDDTFRRRSRRHEPQHRGRLSLSRIAVRDIRSSSISEYQRQLSGLLGRRGDAARQPLAQAGQHTDFDQSDRSLGTWAAASVAARPSVPAIQQCDDSIANARAGKLLRRDGTVSEAIFKGSDSWRELHLVAVLRQHERGGRNARR